MKMSMEDLKEHFNKSSELIKLNQENLSDDEFAEIIRNNFTTEEFGNNLIEFIINEFGERFKLNGIRDDFDKIFTFEILPENKDSLFFLMKAFVIAKKITLPLKENDNSGIINLITTFKPFQDEINLRVNQLKNDLIKKHAPFSEYVNFHFNNFLNSLNKELNEKKESYGAFNDLEISGEKIFNSFIPQRGRPTDLLFNTFLLKINEFGDDLCPEEKYAKLIKPFFIFIADNYPKLIDINDVNDTDKLRRRVMYLKPQQAPPVE